MQTKKINNSTDNQISFDDKLRRHIVKDLKKKGYQMRCATKKEVHTEAFEGYVDKCLKMVSKTASQIRTDL